VNIDGRLLCYYLLFFAALALLLALLRIVNSPFGRVLEAIRENEFRAEALGYRVVVFRTLSSVISALFATLAGVMLALWLAYNGPDTSLSFEIMIDVLLILVIGGMGTMYGAVISAALFVVAQNYLQDLLRLGSEATAASLAGRHLVAGSLAVVAGRAVRGIGLLLSQRHRRQAARAKMKIDGLLARHARFRPQHTAVVFGKTRLSYRQYHERISRLAAALQALA